MHLSTLRPSIRLHNIQRHLVLDHKSLLRQYVKIEFNLVLLFKSVSAWLVYSNRNPYYKNIRVHVFALMEVRVDSFQIAQTAYNVLVPLK